jgi:transposase
VEFLNDTATEGYEVSKVELFELIRRDYYVDGQSLRAIAQARGVHRRTVRQALASARPAPRKAPVREPTVLTRALRQIIDGWLQADRQAPRKQRHTGVRVYERLVGEHGYGGAAVTVRCYVGQRRRELGQVAEAFVPQGYGPGEEAQVDWYEAAVDGPSGREVMQVFLMRACYSGREFHMAFPRQTQQAFLEGHVAGFAYFGGVFARVRYDNLGAAVKKVLRGRRRAETDQFIALRSHYLFEADFCRAGLAGAHEKGGVEGAVGRFRRHHWVPVPAMADLAGLNRSLRAACAQDDGRCLTGRVQSIASDWAQEQPRLRPLPDEPFATADTLSCRVDSSARIRVRTNAYSVPVRLVGRRVEVRLHATRVEVLCAGQVVTDHARLQGRFGERLELDHYLELLQAKPGALPRARALHQARERGCWPSVYDRLWEVLKQRFGESEGNRQLLAVVWLHRDYPVAAIEAGVTQALALGCIEAGAIAVLVRNRHRPQEAAPALDELGRLAGYGQARAVDLHAYDTLCPSQRGEVSHD